MPGSKHISWILCSALLASGCGSDATPAGAPEAHEQVGADGGQNREGMLEPGPEAGVDARDDGAVTLFYLDIGAGLVLRIHPGEAEPTVIADSESVAPDGIDIDVGSGHVYWTNMGDAAEPDGFILRSDLDGSNIETIVEPGQTYTPKQLKIDELHGKLYWSDREGMKVQRANLDGSSLETLVTVASGDAARADVANHCVGIAVDPEGGWFYWTQKGPDNGHVGMIRRARMDMPPGEDHDSRTDVENLFEGLPEPIDLDLDLDGGFIYWTDRGDDTVNRAPIEIPDGETAASRSDREILVTGVAEAIGITLDLDGGVMYYTGLGGQLGRANLDGSEAGDLLREQRVLTGIVHAQTSEL